VDEALTLGDVAPAIPAGGYVDSVARGIADDTMTTMINGGPDGQPFNWKWNRFLIPPFPTNSLQQDYFIPGLLNLGWLENCWALNINSTAVPKTRIPVEVKRDLDPSSALTGNPIKICWIYSEQALTGTWGATDVAEENNGLTNPGPGSVYKNPLNQPQAPSNPINIITDPNGNLWALTQYGTCGNTQPVWPTSPVYPTIANPTTVATTQSDGSCVWTAINPKSQAMRLGTLIAQNGLVWVVNPIGQMRAVQFANLAQTIDPIPDEYFSHFKQGFFAQCYRRNPDPKVRARFKEEWSLWLKALKDAVTQGDKEQDDYGFYPGQSVMETGYYYQYVTPSQPFGPAGY